MLILPDQFDQTAPYELLRAAEMGLIGFDQRLIQSLTARPEQSIDALVRFSSEFRTERLLDLQEQVLDLFRHFRTPKAIPFYLHLARQEDDGMPDGVVEAFFELGEPGVEPLLAAYREADPQEDGANLPFLLAALRVRDPRILKILIDTLKRDVYEGALCLGLYGDPEAVAALEAARPDSPAEEKAIRDTLAQLKDPAPSEPAPPYDLSELYPDTAPPDFEAMAQSDCVQFLDCPVADYRRQAADSFCDESYPAPVKMRLMEHALTDEDASVRGSCWRALREVVEDDPKVAAAMLAALRDESRPTVEREGALTGLANGSGIDTEIRAFYAKPETRAAAVEAMWRSLNPKWRPQILECLTSKQPQILRQAVFGVGALSLSDSAQQLVPLFDDDEVRGDALFAYALAAPGKTSVRALEKLFSRIDELAGGLTADEGDMVGIALDRRLEREGLEPYFRPDDGPDDDDHSPTIH